MTKKHLKSFAFLCATIITLCVMPSFTACGNNEQLPEQLTHNHENLNTDDVCKKCGWQVLLKTDNGERVYMVKDGKVSAEYYGETVEGYGLTNPLVSVYISEKVKEVAEYAFCAKEYTQAKTLEAVKIEKGVKIINDYAFEDNTELSVVSYTGDIADWLMITHGSSLLYYADAFYVNGKFIKDLTIPDNISEIKGNCFKGYWALTSVTIPDSVTKIDGFSSCVNLKKVTFGKNSKLKSIEHGAFDWCTSLTSITIPDSVINIGEYAFRGCSNLTSIIIGNNVSYIEKYAFDKCEKLKNVTFKATDGWYCIDYDYQDQITKLASIDLLNKETAAKFITEAYRSCVWEKAE